MSKISVGVAGSHYNYAKNICLPLDRYAHRRVYDFNAVGKRLPFLRPMLPIHSQLFSSPYYPRTSLLHLWQRIAATRTPWIATTSIGLPFNWPTKDTTDALKRLADSSCKRIIVNSYFAKDKQIAKAKRNPELQDAIIGKIEYLPPAQVLHLKSIADKKRGSALRLLFVGHDFTRKGGVETVMAFKRAQSLFPQISLTVVSRLTVNPSFNYANCEKLRKALEIIGSGDVLHLESEPHCNVIQRFLEADLALLPSYRETYGYSVIEAQACGTPVITTDINAFTEINPEESGWKIKLADPRDYSTLDDIEKIGVSDRLEQAIFEILIQTAESRTLLDEKGLRALDRIQSKHDPSEHAKRLEAIYDGALAGAA